MSQKYKVIWSNIAEKDLLRIVENLATDLLRFSVSLFNEIREKTSYLYEMPYRGCIVPELQTHGILQHREILIKSWRMIYRIFEEDVYVLGVFDSRQNIEDVILDRLIFSTE